MQINITVAVVLVNYTSKKQTHRKKLESRSQWASIFKVLTLKIVNSEFLLWAQWLTNPTRNCKPVGSIPGLAQWVKGLALL